MSSYYNFSAWNLQWPQRGSLASGCISDIYDGELYQALSSSGGPLIAGKYISFTLNTDGVDCFHSTRESFWPVLLINELPFSVRWVGYSCIFPLPLPLFLNLLITVWVCITFMTGGYPKTWSLAGLWFHSKKPPMHMYLKPASRLGNNRFVDYWFLYHLTHVQPCMSILLILCLYRCCGWCTWCCRSLCDDGARHVIHVTSQGRHLFKASSSSMVLMTVVFVNNQGRICTQKTMVMFASSSNRIIKTRTKDSRCLYSVCQGSCWNQLLVNTNCVCAEYSSRTC